MSILIHGMSLPKDGCKSCGFDIYGSCLIRANMDKPYEVTHSCPLIELPPHGRLGDLDALIIDLMDRGVDGVQTDDLHEILQTIMDANTIIPAEEE